MKRVDLTVLPEYLQSRRWFAGKAWPIKRISVIDHASVEIAGRAGFTLGVIEVVYELGSPEWYFLPVTIDARGRFKEAIEDDVLARELLRLIRDGAEMPSGAGALRAERTAGSEPIWNALSEAPEVKVLTIEQSNTSIVFDRKVILKLIRKVEPGMSPEVEIGRFLARAGFPHAPRLVGSLLLTGAADATIAVAHEFIPDAMDGWAYLLEGLRRGGVTPELLSQLTTLGARVGALHVALASDPADPAFAPEPILEEDLQRWSSSIIGELGVTLAGAASLIPELESRREPLRQRARKLSRLAVSGSKMRIHGDLHLGQVLRTGSDWMVFDFEGEPGRSYQQRREKVSPLKDVAGMLRSFSYASAALAQEGAPAHPIGPMREAFLQGYLDATRTAAFLPTSPETLQGMLDAFELEKLLYELRYEVSHRPGWVKIPAQALLAEAGG